MHIVLLQSCSYAAHFSVYSLNCLIERLHERIPRSCFNFLSSCASSYLHPDDVCHPVDLRLPLVAAEMPEEEKAWSPHYFHTHFNQVAGLGESQQWTQFLLRGSLNKKINKRLRHSCTFDSVNLH